MEGQKLLLSTDGLTGAALHDDIVNVFGRDEELEVIADQLVNLANQSSGKDNVTVIIVVA